MINIKSWIINGSIINVSIISILLCFLYYLNKRKEYFTINLINAVGKIVYTSNLLNQPIPVSHFENGVYFLEIYFSMLHIQNHL